MATIMVPMRIEIPDDQAARYAADNKLPAHPGGSPRMKNLVDCVQATALGHVQESVLCTVYNATITIGKR